MTRGPATSRRLLIGLLVAAGAQVAPAATPRLYSQETERFRVVYYSPAHEYLAPLLIRSLENALKFDYKAFGYQPDEKITVLLEDFRDFGYGAAGTLPANMIQIGIAPFNTVYETIPGNERMAFLANHELIHIVIGDRASSRDARFRALFRGKIAPTADDPIAVPFSFLASPRQYSPRWFHEGTATFMETWMAGGIGRGLTGYDEMVFRAMVRDDRYIYEFVGLESEGTTVDFQVGANSYLYGTRFLNYLARQHGPSKVMEWLTRKDGSKAYFQGHFQQVFGQSMRDEWRSWIATERRWQAANLKKIREYPTTPLTRIGTRALGSVSRPYYDEQSKQIYAAIRHPGRMSYLAALDVESGSLRHLKDIRGGALYYVTSLAFDPDGKRLFYTTNNTGLRALNVLDLGTGDTRLLFRDLRTGDLVYNRRDGTLWGIRHADGLSQIVRLDPPFTTVRVLYSFPYAQDLSDIDISPDGEQLTGALSDAAGRQKLVRYRTADLLEGKAEAEVLHDFEFNAPGSFVFSPDGGFLYGSSYMTGASNLFRYDLSARRLEALSNAETGLFRPVPLPDYTLAAFEYTPQGFMPVRLPVAVVEDVNAVPYLGQDIVRKYPEVKSWKLPSRASIDDLALRTYAGEYRPLRSMRLVSAYPIVQGYKDSAAAGYRFDFSDGLGLSRGYATLSVSPSGGLPANERIHARLEANYWNWAVSAYYNNADFYDLFGPTKVSRRGFGMRVDHRTGLLFDTPRRLDLNVGIAGYAGLDRLPEYQNIATSRSRFMTGRVSLDYSDLERSIGAVEEERGTTWNVAAKLNYTGPKAFPRVSAGYDRGFLLPLKNSSLWVRSSAGKAFGDRDDPFANFYFGAFGNNWVDKAAFSRYREYYSFPGVKLNEIGGADFAKSMLEWNLPPVRFRSIGNTLVYCNWARLSLFSGVMGTNLGSGSARREYVNGGAQLDFRVVLFTYLNSTFSTGYAVARGPQGRTGTEFMMSLKLM